MALPFSLVLHILLPKAGAVCPSCVRDRYGMMKHCIVLRKSGADERSRTSDLLITNQLLYQLSYIGVMDKD